MSNYWRVIQKPMGVRKMEIYAKMTILTPKIGVRDVVGPQFLRHF